MKERVTRELCSLYMLTYFTCSAASSLVLTAVLALPRSAVVFEAAEYDHIDGTRTERGWWVCAESQNTEDLLSFEFNANFKTVDSGKRDTLIEFQESTSLTHIPKCNTEYLG
jgi:hypothetical protein